MRNVFQWIVGLLIRQSKYSDGSAQRCSGQARTFNKLVKAGSSNDTALQAKRMIYNGVSYRNEQRVRYLRRGRARLEVVAIIDVVKTGTANVR